MNFTQSDLGTFALLASTTTNFTVSDAGTFAAKRLATASDSGRFQSGVTRFVLSDSGLFSNNVDRADEATDTEIDYGTASLGDIAVFNSQYRGDDFAPPDYWVTRRYRVLLRGDGTNALPDLLLNVSSLSATLKASGASSLSVTVPDTGAIIDDLVARKNKKLVVFREYVYASGIVVKKRFIKIPFREFSSSETPQGVSISLSGRKRVAACNRKRIVIENVFSREFSSGTVTFSGAINDRLKIGHVAVVTLPTGTVKTHRVKEISYEISPDSESMRFIEYDQDGIDKPFFIGKNAR